MHDKMIIWPVDMDKGGVCEDGACSYHCEINGIPTIPFQIRSKPLEGKLLRQ